VAASAIAPEALQRLPMQIGDWTGQDVPLAETIVRKTGTDGHINRRYSRHGGLENVGLYIAYGITARALAGHRPENCYKGAGWTLLDRQSMEVSLANGGGLPCSIFNFSRGGLNAERIVVLDYFIVDGRLCGDASLLLSRAWRGSDTVDYVAQVQISSTGNLPGDSATRIVSTFAADSARLIADLFEHTQEDQIAGIPDATKERDSL
jgi:EpsI family protein